MERSVSVIMDDLCFVTPVVLCFKSMSGMPRALKNLFFFFSIFFF